jgi:hypothetical protein
MSMSRAFVLASLLLAALGGCHSKKTEAPLGPTETLDTVLVPDALIAAIGKAGGGHYHATALFRAEAERKVAASEGKPASPPAVTTMTDLWLDGKGNFRLLETNDQDGGREIIRQGRDIAVALRYGKLVKRQAENGEIVRFLAEAVGAPRAAWEVVRRQVLVKATAPGRYELAQAAHATELPSGFFSAQALQGGLQAWRRTVEVQSLIGRAGVEIGVPQIFECTAHFRATRDDLPIDGDVAVVASVDQLGKVPDVVMPEAESLQVRQRTILEEKALLSGIRSTLPLPTPSPKQGSTKDSPKGSTKDSTKKAKKASR